MLEAGVRRAYLREKAAKLKTEVEDLVNLKWSRLRKRPSNATSEAAAETPEVDEGFIAIASKAYEPVYYPGKVILFRSLQQPLGVHESASLGWEGLSRELEIHEVIGLHAAVVAEPRVRFLVDKLAPCLAAAQAAHASPGK